MKKFKKAMSLVLALAMIFALSVSVFAEEEATDTNKFETTATVAIPEIDVEVPDDAPVFINPMGFKLIVSGDNGGKSASGDEEAYLVSSNKIVSPVFQIKNASPMKLGVSVIGTAIADKTQVGFTMVNAPISSVKLDSDGNAVKDDDGKDVPNTENQVFIYVAFDKVNGEGDEATMKDVAYYKDVTKKEVNSNVYGLLIKAASTSDKAKEVGEIAAASDGEPTILGFKFLGDVNSNAAKDYTSGKSVPISMTFTFKPKA